MIDYNQAYFISLLADYINERKTDTPSFFIDWEALIACSKRHEMSGILYYQCREFIPEKYKEQLSSNLSSELFYYANRIELEKKIINRFSEESVACFIVKGTAVAEYYPMPALRSMGDTDLLIHKEDYDKAHKMLLSMGFLCKIINASYYKDEMLFEIHAQLISDSYMNNSELCAYFSDYWKYVDSGKLDWNYHFLFLIFHFWRHFFDSGVGLRHFADIAVLSRNNAELDWNYIERKLKEIGLWSFAQKVFDLNKRWFNVEVPLAIETMDEDFYLEVTEQILRNGVFGYNNAENRANKIVQSETDEKKYSSVMRKRLCNTVFLKYDYMILMPEYSFLKGRPILLPAAWVYRGIRTVKSYGIKRTFQKLKSPFVNKKMVKNGKNILRSGSSQ